MTKSVPSLIYESPEIKKQKQIDKNSGINDKIKKVMNNILNN
jgi:hypothetical protein